MEQSTPATQPTRRIHPGMASLIKQCRMHFMCTSSVQHY